MDNLLLHPKTKASVDKVIARPSSAILLSGAKGVNKKEIAVNLAEAILDIADINAYPYALVISPDTKQIIAIESVRTLNQFLSLKVLSQKPISRVIIINEADTMSLPAQNALLKTLEELPKNTVAIMTASNEQALLPTIRSRLQTLPVNRPLRSSLREKHQAISDSEFNKLYALSAGSPELIEELIKDKDHPLHESATYARKILSGSTFDRLLLIDELAKQKELVKSVILTLQQMAHLSLSSGSKNANIWQRVLSASYSAEEDLNKNGQVKLVLTNLMLNL